MAGRGIDAHEGEDDSQRRIRSAANAHHNPGIILAAEASHFKLGLLLDAKGDALGAEAEYKEDQAERLSAARAWWLDGAAGTSAAQRLSAARAITARIS